MATKNLVYHAYDASSLPVDGVDVTLECFASDGSRSVFYGTLHLLAPYTGTTGADGSVTINNVPANADCDDPYSYYLFTARGVLELTAGGGQGYFDQFYVVVPHSGSSPIDISTIKRDAPPTPGGSTPLHDQTSHQGDIWPDATDQVAGTSTLQIAQQSAGGVSAPPAGSRKLFVRDSDGHFALMKSDSSVVDLEAGGSGLSGGTPALTLDTSNSAGVASTGIRTDATIAAFDATNPTTSAMGDAAATGSAGTAARRDHKHGRESFATNAIALGASAAAGVATTPFRSDDTIAAFDITNPVIQAFGDTPATGSAAKAARRDHKHGMPNSTAGPDADVTIDAAGAAGTAGTAARSGHGHKLATSANTPAAVSTAGAAGTSGHAPSRDDHVHAHETAHVAHDTIWDAANDYLRGSGADTGVRQAASSATPAVTAASGSAGTAANPPSADDHVHAIGSGSVGNGLSLASGVLSTLESTAQTADVTTSQTTSSATYTDLTTAGPSITATIGASGKALVLISATITSNSNGNVQYASLSVDGGTPVDADAALTANAQNQKPSRQILVTGLSTGSHTFKMQYRAGAGTGTFADRRIVVVPL